jgi:hypothetical protein
MARAPGVEEELLPFGSDQDSRHSFCAGIHIDPAARDRIRRDRTCGEAEQKQPERASHGAPLDMLPILAPCALNPAGPEKRSMRKGFVYSGQWFEPAFTL